MANCKQNFLSAVEGHTVLCAEITYGQDYWDDKDRRSARLQVGFSDEQYQAFLNDIDYEYDSGFGGQEVYGNIWYTDGTWSERAEYDGSEWWAYKACPEIPKELKSS